MPKLKKKKTIRFFFSVVTIDKARKVRLVVVAPLAIIAKAMLHYVGIVAAIAGAELGHVHEAEARRGNERQLGVDGGVKCLAVGHKVAHQRVVRLALDLGGIHRLAQTLGAHAVDVLVLAAVALAGHQATLGPLRVRITVAVAVAIAVGRIFRVAVELVIRVDVEHKLRIADRRATAGARLQQQIHFARRVESGGRHVGTVVPDA